MRVSKLIALLVLALPVLASAEDKSDGCGLGWQITNKTSFLATTTRGTTNAFVPPTFGMTTGTIGCSQHSFAKHEIPAATFVASNQEVLKMEMAQGSGEHVAALSRTMGCGSDLEVGKTLQNNFRSITLDGNANSIDMYLNVKKAVKANPALNCTNV